MTGLLAEIVETKGEEIQEFVGQCNLDTGAPADFPTILQFIDRPHRLPTL